MLAIARALMARPRLVIFDEISLGLAPLVMDKLYETLALMKQARMTLIVIEQDVDRALALADQRLRAGAWRVRALRQVGRDRGQSSPAPYLYRRCGLTGAT